MLSLARSERCEDENALKDANNEDERKCADKRALKEAVNEYKQITEANTVQAH